MSVQSLVSQSEALSTVFRPKPVEESRYITPFDEHMDKYFDNIGSFSRSEVVENFMLALDKTAEEIDKNVIAEIARRVTGSRRNQPIEIKANEAKNATMPSV